MINMIEIKTPISNEIIKKLKINDKITISGTIYTGRDAILPKLGEMIKNNEKLPIDLKGSAIMHTAVSDAGIATTTSNKKEIESNIPILSKTGVKIHIGKGALSEETKNILNKENSIYVVSPPVAALLTDSILSKKCVMFKEEGIEACFKLKVKNIPGVVAIANGESIF